MPARPCLSRLLYGCLIPLAGCMTAGEKSVFQPLTPVGGIAEGKEKKLPDRESADILLKLAGDLEKNGYLGDAIAKLEMARQLDPKLKLNHKLAVLYDLAGDERRAMTEFEAALKKAPKDADLLNDFGYCHYNRGRWAEAEAKYRAAIAAKPDHARANVNLGLALAQQGKIDEALAAFQKVNRPAEAKSNVAFVLAAQGKKDEARELYREALRMEPALITAREGMRALDKAPAQPSSGVVPASGSHPGQRSLPPAGSGFPREPEPDMSPITLGPRGGD
jgi:Tfp pilus assembly protein PilF